MQKKAITILIIIIFSLIFFIPSFSYSVENIQNDRYIEQKIENEQTITVIKGKDITGRTTGSAKLDIKDSDLDKYNSKGTWSPSFRGKINIIFSIIRMIGALISVIVLVMIGIKYMFASIDEKADYKKTMIPYIIGAAIVFSGSVFANVIYKTVEQIVKLVAK